MHRVQTSLFVLTSALACSTGPGADSMLSPLGSAGSGGASTGVAAAGMSSAVPSAGGASTAGMSSGVAPMAGMANLAASAGMGPMGNPGGAASAGMGGTAPMGGMSAGGTGVSGLIGSAGDSMGGMPAEGGSGGVATGGAPEETGGASTETGGTSSGGECVKGMTSGDEVLFIGESFIAASTIPQEVASLAQENGSLDANEQYRNNSVSGTTLAGGGNSIPNQYQSGIDSGPVKYVLMNGGGNDCWQANDPDGALAAAATLFENMAQNGTEKILYFFYPDPLDGIAGSPPTSLKNCLDELRPQMQAMCAELTTPQCSWVDLRETWDGQSGYTNDGLHPTPAGSVATAGAIWEAMVENCIAQ